MTRDTSAVGALDALAWRGWVVLHDVARPGRRRATIDHVLVGPGGVFVTSRKKWPGPVAIVDGELHLAGRASSREITEVIEAAADVLALVPDVPVHPVLCLERHQPVTGWVHNVMICASSNVEELLTTRPAVLGPEQVQQFAGVLGARLPRVMAPGPTAPMTYARAALSRPLRALVQAGTMAAAALLVIGVLQTRVVDQISSAVDGFVTEVVTVGDKSKRKPAPVQPRERTSPGQGARERGAGRGDRTDTRADSDKKAGSDKKGKKRADRGKNRGERDHAKKRGKRQADTARPTRPGRKASGRDRRPGSPRRSGQR